jgi:hypothetical protein
VDERSGTDMSDLSIQDIFLILSETQKAIKRADVFVDMVIKSGADSPQSLNMMVEPTLKIKDILLKELANLEEAYGNAVQRS